MPLVHVGDDRGLLGEGPYGEAELAELGGFLGSAQAPQAMDPSWLDGFLCALIGGPVLVPPSVWLPLVWRGSPPAFRSQRQAERILSLLFRHANHVASTLQDGTYLPVLPAEVPEGVNNLAQLWCAGYAEGIARCQNEWKLFFDDETAAMLFMPIMALGAQALWDGEGIPEVDLLITALPAAVMAIAAYWRDPPTRRAPKHTKRTRPPATSAATSVHCLKIQLVDVKPAVWRRVEIPSDAKLPHVSRILLAAMGWNDTHLHGFRVGGATYGARDPDFPGDKRSERSVTLAQIAPQPKSRFFFDDDFGDGWEHRVTVEAIVDAKDADAPRCVAGARACPPEDCGGPFGYADLLDVLADPQHEEHGEMRRWVGDDFDPSVFDLRRANVEIRALTRRGRRASS